MESKVDDVVDDDVVVDPTTNDEIPPEIGADEIMVGGDEPITFSDKPDGTPDDPPPTEAEADKPPAEEVVEKPKRKRRNRKDLQARIDEYAKRALTAEERAAAAEAALELANKEKATEPAKKDAPELSERETELALLKKEAIDEGDLDAYDKAQEELYDIRQNRQRQEAEQAKPEADTEEANAQADPIHPTAEAWITRNQWFQSKDNDYLADQAMRIEARLRLEEKLDVGEKLYERLDEELAKLPEFDYVLGDVTPAKSEDTADDDDKPKSTVARPSNGAEPPATPARPGALTKYDIETMRRFGLDHNDPKVRSAYLSRKSNRTAA